MPKKKDYEDMYNLYIDKIYAFLYWRTNDYDLAHDLTSEVFTKAWRMWDNFDGRYAQAWIFTIARNLLTDYWRKKHDLRLGSELAESISDENTTTSEIIDANIEVGNLRKAINSLPNNIKEVVMLRFIYGNSAKDTGEILGLSEANVRVIQFRALKKLKVWLEKNGK